MHSDTAALSKASIWHEALRIVNEEGFRAFWKRNPVTIAHHLPYSSVNIYAYEHYKSGVGPSIAISFSVYEALRSYWHSQRPDDSTAIVSLSCGSLSGIASSTATFPLDLVRRRKQLEGVAGQAHVKRLQGENLFNEMSNGLTVRDFMKVNSLASFGEKNLKWNKMDYTGLAVSSPHAGKVYTRNVFNKFKKSWSKVFHYKVENVRNGNGFQSFVVKSKDDELEKFDVTLDSQTYEGKCECQQFEFVGILCPHILKVFVRLDIDEIPEHFILPRWRQKANKFRIIDSQGLVHDDGKEESEALRLSHMCQEATKLACLAAPSNEAYTIFIKGMNDVFEKIQEVSKVSPIEICANKDNEKSIEPSPSQILLLDPNISQCKGRKKDVKGKAATTQSERLKSGIEMSLNKKKRKCHMCFQFGHDKRTCPSNPMRKTNIDLEEEAEGSDSDQEEGSDCSE
ncbi:hypothetical protein RHGRI_029085 [Rhododendron griersonianum]|uniref:Protein FAR1-RELATED SEQUENCE n=1 Tax=Rhododendron griersonianum TaxID=479676 RepID=A0AAV6IIF7_9ERIC|nr:hypothetical protein RHGRI_029085 [Rhododendron griersonianum]